MLPCAESIDFPTSMLKAAGEWLGEKSTIWDRVLISSAFEIIYLIQKNLLSKYSWLVSTPG